MAHARTQSVFSRRDRNPGMKLEYGVEIVLNFSKLRDTGSDGPFIVHTVIGLVV